MANYPVLKLAVKLAVVCSRSQQNLEFGHFTAVTIVVTQLPNWRAPT